MGTHSVSLVLPSTRSRVLQTLRSHSDVSQRPQAFPSLLWGWGLTNTFWVDVSYLSTWVTGWSTKLTSALWTREIRSITLFFLVTLQQTHIFWDSWPMEGVSQCFLKVSSQRESNLNRHLSTLKSWSCITLRQMFVKKKKKDPSC